MVTLHKVLLQNFTSPKSVLNTENWMFQKTIIMLHTNRYIHINKKNLYGVHKSNCP